MDTCRRGGGVIDSFSADQIQALAREGARVRLEALRTEIAALEGLLGEREGGSRRRGRGRPRTRRRGQLSAAGRAAIAAGQKARWEKVKAAQSTDASSAADGAVRQATLRRRRKRSTMSAAARKAVSDRMRKYLANRRKAGAKK